MILPFYVHATINFNNKLHLFSVVNIKPKYRLSPYTFVKENVKDVIIKYNLVAVLYNNNTLEIYTYFHLNNQPQLLHTVKC